MMNAYTLELFEQKLLILNQLTGNIPVPNGFICENKQLFLTFSNAPEKIPFENLNNLIDYVNRYESK